MRRLQRGWKKFFLVVCLLMLLGHFWHQKRAWIIIDYLGAKWSNLECFECWFQKLTYEVFFPLSFGYWIWILNPIWKILSIVEVWKWLDYKLTNLKVNFKISQLITFFKLDEKFIYSGQNWLGKMPHMSKVGISTQNIPNWTI